MTKASRSLCGIAAASLVAVTSAPAIAGECAVNIYRNGQHLCNPGRQATAAELKDWPETLTREQWAELERRHTYTDQDVLDELFREYPQKSRR